MKKLYPGKKVHIPEHVIHTIDHGIGAYEIVATKHSIGTILSYDEYSARVKEAAVRDDYGHHPDHVAEHLAWVKSGIKKGTHYPIRLEEVVPLSDDDFATLKQEIGILEVSCRVGAIHIFNTESFEKNIKND